MKLSEDAQQEARWQIAVVHLIDAGNLAAAG